MNIHELVVSVLTQLYFKRVTIAVFIVTLTLVWFWWKKPHPKFPPGPRGIPFLGVIPWLSQTPEKEFKKWSLEKYGPIMSVRVGIDDVIILNTFDAVTKAFVDQGHATSGRPWINLFHQVSGYSGIAFRTYGEHFKALKQFGLQTLKNLGMGKHEMEKIINEETQYFIEFLKTKLGKPVDLKMDFYNLIANIVSKLVLGRRFEYDDPIFKGVFKDVQQLFGDADDSSKVMIMNLFELLRFIPPFYGVNKRMALHQKRISDGLRPIIEEHKATFDKNDKRDFIDYFISEQIKERKDNNTNKQKIFTDSDLDITVRDIFMAGTETSSTSLLWLFLLVMHYPEHYRRIIQEIDSVLGSDKYASIENRKKMPFTSAFVQEFYRFRTVSPLPIEHITVCTANINGYVIPKGTKMWSNLWGVHNDPNLWPNPETFDPYRHINKDGKFVFSKKIIPFGTGPRLCLGESLARMEVFIIFVTILQKFTIAPAHGKPMSLDNGVDQFVFSPQPYEIILQER